MIPVLLRLAVPIALVMLYVYALVDAISVPDDSQYQMGNKLIWVLVILFAPVIGAVLYLVLGRPTARRSPRGPNRPPPDDII